MSWPTKKFKNLPKWSFWLLITICLALIIYIDSLELSFTSKFYNYFTKLNLSGNFIVIILAIIGWVVALILQRKNIKDQLSSEIKYDIYKQLVGLHKEIQSAIAELSAKISPPFIEMDSCMISFNVKLKTEQEALLDGGKKWLEYLQLIITNYFEFVDKCIDLQYTLEDWIAPIKDLCTTRDVFMKEIDEQKTQIYNGINALQMYSVNNGYDWRNWDKEKINQIVEDIRKRLLDMSCYLHDLLVLVHNNLLSGYFKYSRPLRKTLDEKYKVLTRDGFVIRLETDKEEIARYKKIIEENSKHESKN